MCVRINCCGVSISCILVVLQHIGCCPILKLFHEDSYQIWRAHSLPRLQLAAVRAAKRVCLDCTTCFLQKFNPRKFSVIRDSIKILARDKTNLAILYFICEYQFMGVEAESKLTNAFWRLYKCKLIFRPLPFCSDQMKIT